MFFHFFKHLIQGLGQMLQILFDLLLLAAGVIELLLAAPIDLRIALQFPLHLLDIPFQLLTPFIDRFHLRNRVRLAGRQIFIHLVQRRKPCAIIGRDGCLGAVDLIIVKNLNRVKHAFVGQQRRGRKIPGKVQPAVVRDGQRQPFTDKPRAVDLRLPGR
ncbi:MAG: hypothetical protein BWY83_01252 [bacterium ADurb.Bin478]|nr:MAG: hypothetical protein BWY83_01252 [bacterium ADurb.Bin478]